MVGPVAVEFRPQALVEFADLLRYYSTIGGRTLAERVRDDIEQVLVRLSDDPFSAQAFEGHPTLRRAVSRRYRFVVAYQVEGDTVLVEAIYRYQNKDFA